MNYLNFEKLRLNEIQLLKSLSVSPDIDEFLFNVCERSLAPYWEKTNDLAKSQHNAGHELMHFAIGTYGLKVHLALYFLLTGRKKYLSLFKMHEVDADVIMHNSIVKISSNKSNSQARKGAIRMIETVISKNVDY